MAPQEAAAATADDNPLPPAVDKKQANINDCIRGLQAVNVNVGQFTVVNVNAVRITTTYFCKQCKVLKPFNDNGEMESVLNLGIEHGMFQSFQQMTVKQFFQFLIWLRKTDGQNALQARLQRNKMMRKAAKRNRSLEDLAWLQAFNLMYQDWIIERKRVRDRNDREIQETRMRYELEEEVEFQSP